MHLEMCQTAESSCEVIPAKCLRREASSQASKGLDPDLVDGYWSGNFQVPSAIDSHVASYLSQSDATALTRAAIWIASNHVLSGYRPKHHMSLVRWLFEHGLLERSVLLGLLALVSLGGNLMRQERRSH